MTVLLISFVIILVAVLGLSLGVLLGRRPIQGSCGGIGGRCGACSRGCREQGAEVEFEQQREKEQPCQSRSPPGITCPPH
jgi:hypothetical protein